MKPIWKVLQASQLGDTLEAVKKNLGGFTVEIAQDLQRILNNGATVKDNLAMTYVEFDAIHGTETRVANPFRSVPQAFIPISAFSLTGGTNGVGIRNTGVQQVIASHVLNTSRTDGFLGITVQYAQPASGELLGPISRLRSASLGLTTGTPANLGTTASVTLTPGYWEISGAVGFAPGGATSLASVLWAVSKTSATLPAVDTSALPTAAEVRYGIDFPATVGYGAIMFAIAPYRVFVSVNTPLYLVVQAAFTISTCVAWGSMEAQRVGIDPATTARVRGILVEA